MSDVGFPDLSPTNADAPLVAVLPGQIYTIDGLFSGTTLRRLVEWCASLQLEPPKPPAKGEAERTSRRAAILSPSIAAAVLSVLSPYLPRLHPPSPSPARPSARDTAPLLSPNIRVYHYPPTTFFRAHYDAPQLDLYTRRLSCWTVLVYLSDGVVGGGTTFHLGNTTAAGAGAGAGAGRNGRSGKVKAKDKERANTRSRGRDTDRGKQQTEAVWPQDRITVEAKAGRVLFHWHGRQGGGCLLHEGDEVLSGDKWVLRTDVLA